MARTLKSAAWWLLLLPLSSGLAVAQNPQFLPELDAYYRLNPQVRFQFQAKEDRDGGDPQQLSIGPSLQLSLKPLIKLQEVTKFDLDDAKSRPLVFEAGYRYVATPGSAPTNRMELIQISNFPLIAEFFISDRNRADLDWKSGGFKWRYRNKLTVEKALVVHSYHFRPYVAAEVYYQSQYEKWSETSLFGGFLLPLRKWAQVDLYYEHDNITGKSPNQQTNSVGLLLNLFFSTRK